MKHQYVEGVSAELRVDRVPLEEFDDQEDSADELTTTKYVEAVSGATFTVDLKFDPSFPYLHNDIAAHIQLDGKRVEGVVASPSDHGEAKVSGVPERKDGHTYFRKFVFAELITGDGPVAAHLKDELKGLGTVTVEMTRCVRTSSYLQAKDSYAFKPVGGEKVSEKALKGRAISSRISLSEGRKVDAIRSVDVTYPYGSQPFARFTFKYRSHRDLQIEGIIERSPTPTPLEDRDPETLTRSELQELLRRRNEELREASLLKREKSVKRERSPTIIMDSDDEEVLITGEGSSKRRRHLDDSGIDIIDLTDD